MKVIKKQKNSSLCIICGVDNALGLKAPFYEMEDGSLWTVFTYSKWHQSYPERVHGGMITALLDELIGRAIWIAEPDVWGVTIDLTIKYRKAVPYDVGLKGIGRITVNKKRIFMGTGVILDQAGNILAEASATYYKMPLKQISSSMHPDIMFMVEDDVRELK